MEITHRELSRPRYRCESESEVKWREVKWSQSESIFGPLIFLEKKWTLKFCLKFTGKSLLKFFLKKNPCKIDRPSSLGMED